VNSGHTGGDVTPAYIKDQNVATRALKHRILNGIDIMVYANF
jgi:hypothetical protein